MSKTGSIKIDLGKLENTCFVVMPFSPLFSTQYERVIKPVVEECGLSCIRGDEVYAKAQVMEDIWQSLRSARVIIAELTGKNPNVLYEVGLAHALGKTVIILTRNQDDVPFDLKALRYLYYDTNDPFWGKNVQAALKGILENVLTQKHISNYLAGISELEKVEYPERPLEAAKETKIAEDVEGTWAGTYHPTDNTIHQAFMSLSQDGKNLTGSLTISFPDPVEMAVVEEIISGTIESLEVALEGVNYTFLKKSQHSDEFLLETFQLTLSADRQTLEGTVTDSAGTYGVSFSKTSSRKHERKRKVKRST